MPGDYGLYHDAPKPLPHTDGHNVRIIAGRRQRDGAHELLSAVAFGCLRGCLGGGRSPTQSTAAHLVHAIHSCVNSRVHRGIAKRNLSRGRGEKRSRSQEGILESSYRCFRAGAPPRGKPATPPAFRLRPPPPPPPPALPPGKAFGDMSQFGFLSEVRRRQASLRCELFLPRADGHFISVPITQKAPPHGTFRSLPIYASTRKRRIVAVPAGSHPPVHGGAPKVARVVSCLRGPPAKW